MHKNFYFFLISLLYLEGIYHLFVYGFVGINPLMVISTTVALAAVETCLVGLFRKRNYNKIIAWILMVFNFLLYVVQVVYFNIFKMPMLIETAVTTGGDALTDFWSVALDGIVRSILPILFMAVPFAAAGLLMHKNIIRMKKYRTSAYIESMVIAIAGISLTALFIVAGFLTKSEFYEEYQGMHSPEDLAKDYGMLPLYSRQFMGDLFGEYEGDIDDWAGAFPPADETENNSNTGNTGGENDTETETGPVIDRSPNVLNIDFDTLLGNDDEDIVELAEMLQAMTPSNKNEYTGIFEGYNLIYLTAEGFSHHAVSEELTPTLYKMINSGIVVKDYYVQSWNTSTTDGEYVNLIGQIPDGQHSMRRSAGIQSKSKFSDPNTYPYSLAAYFAEEGVNSYAYHSNSLSYYYRYKTHPNLGYQFKAAKLGSCSKSEYGDWIFDMEGASSWPNSDYELMVATLPEYISQERFHAYYMTMSGHASYSWTGNAMSYKNKSAVEHLDCSEQMKAYIACNLELEKAMAYLLEELEKAGKLDTTVIVLSADHRPYGLANEKDEIEAFTGREMDEIDLQENCLIMWNSAMETINVEKTCSAMDILPTLLNLFGFEYDSRLFAGRDMLSDSPSLVIFKDKSFITDDVIYDAGSKKVTSRTGAEITEEYMDSMKAYVNAMFKYSKGMLNEDFQNIVSQYVIEEPETTE